MMLWMACGILHAVIACIYLTMWNTGGPVASHSWHGSIVLLGELGIGTSLVTLAAGFWRPVDGLRWPFVLYGLALGMFGLIQYGLTGFRISILVIALLVVAMASSMGMLDFVLARSSWRRMQSMNAWLLTFACAVSIGFVLASLGFGLRWIDMRPGTHLDLLWLGSYFGFNAVCLFMSCARSILPQAAGASPAP